MMNWLKRNIFLASGIAVAIGLLAFAIYFLTSKLSLSQSISDELTQATQELDGLVKKNPHPDKKNIGAAVREEKRLQAYLQQVQQEFPPLDVHAKDLDNQKLGWLLDTTISALQHEAKENGVELPNTNYWFTFETERTAFNYPDPAGLASCLIEVKELSEILFDAKINRLVSMKRARLANETAGALSTSSFMGSGYMGPNYLGTTDSSSGGDFLTAKPQTNNWTIATPYELTFDGFTAELADVLEGLGKSRLCFVINNVVVDQAPGKGEEAAGLGISGSSSADDAYLRRYGIHRAPAPQSVPYSQSPFNPANRYGFSYRGRMGGMPPSLARRYSLGPPPMIAPAAPSGERPDRFGMVTLVHETMLRFTLTLQSIKYRPPEEISERKSLARASQGADASAPSAVALPTSETAAEDPPNK